MSARDAFHPVVKKALQKDGWVITHDPYSLQAGTLELYIDLGAEKVIAAEKQGQKIAVLTSCTKKNLCNFITQYDAQYR